jgi:hypothetical protein
MTNPSIDARKKAAAEALKKKLVDSLVKSSNKTDKVQKLLRESPEYKEYLAHSASSHLAVFKEAGLAETPERRKVAEKSAQLDAQKLMDDDPLGALKERAETLLDELRMMTDGLATQVQKVESTLTAMDEAQKLEFLNTALRSSAMTMFIDKQAVRIAGVSLGNRRQELAKLESSLTKSLGATSKSAVRDVLRDYPVQVHKALESIAASSKQVSEAFGSVAFSIDEEALSALVAQKIKKGQLESLAEARSWLDRFIGVAGGLMESNTITGTISKALKLVTASGQAAARNEIVNDGSTEYAKTHTRNEVYSEHTDNPLLMAKNLVEKQKIALDIFMKSFDTALSGAMIATMGPGEIVMQAWAPISIAIGHVVSSRLDARIKGAENAIAANNAQKALEFESDEQKELESQVKDGILEVLQAQAESFAEGLKDKLGSAASEGGSAGLNTGIGFVDEIIKNPGEFTATVLGWIMPPLMKKIWEIFPPKPAEQITGDDLVKVQNVLFDAQVPSFSRGLGPARPTTGGALTELDGRPTDVAASIWARFESTNAARTTAPNDPASRTYYVSTKVASFGDVLVWGSFNPRTSMFTPAELDPAAIENWAGRTVAGAGYSTGALKTTGPDVRGRWERVKLATFSYVVLNEGGTLHWGQVAANTTGPRGVASQLGALVDGLSPTDRVMAEFAITG